MDSDNELSDDEVRNEGDAEPDGEGDWSDASEVSFEAGRDYGAFYGSALSQMINEGYVYVNERSVITRLHDYDAAQFAEEAKGQEKMRILGDYHEGAMLDAVAVERASAFVSRLPRLLELDLLDGAEGRLAMHVEIDVFLRGMASDSSAKLRSLRLGSMGESADTWRHFATRFAASLTEFCIDTTFISEAVASEVALSLRSHFTSLENFELNCTVSRRNTQWIRPLLEAMRHSTIKGLGVTLRCDSNQPGNAPPLIEELHLISNVVPTCTSLETLSIAWPIGGRTPSGSFLLENVLRSSSAKEISLSSISLLRDGERTSQQTQVSMFTNSTLKTIRLFYCEIGQETVCLLSRCKGLDTVDFDSNHLERLFADPTTGSIPRIEQLISFKDRPRDYKSTPQDSYHYMIWLASNLRNASSLREVTLWLGGECLHPALREVLVSCSAEFTLHLVGEHGSVDSLCAAVEAAQSLTSFTLTARFSFGLSTPDMASILDSVQLNPALRRFSCLFTPFDYLHLESHLENFISNNGALEEFEFFEDPGDDQLSYVEGIIRGLRRNRRLRKMNVRVYDPEFVDADFSQKIVDMLQDCNTSLQCIEGIRYLSREHEERIDALLALNRYGLDFAANAHRVPMECWSDVLSRISTTECNYFVTKLARQALVGSQGDNRNSPANAAGTASVATRRQDPPALSSREPDGKRAGTGKKRRKSDD
jgi:hypothetical protein